MYRQNSCITCTDIHLMYIRHVLILGDLAITVDLFSDSVHVLPSCIKCTIAPKYTNALRTQALKMEFGLKCHPEWLGNDPSGHS